MCDTVLATPGTTASGSMLFGKNSDRQRNEAHVVEILPRAAPGEGQEVRCQYISIPQAARTNAILLCRQFWAWGCEMGANEHGVVIGNEAVHARIPASQDNALTGNDLIRLALERASTAAEAVETITELLARYGQGGNCGHLTPQFYNNGFMIADATEGYVLETLGREWLLERVTAVRAISNRYSISSSQARTSEGLNRLVDSYGWKSATPDDYATFLANPDREHIGQAGARRMRAESLLTPRSGSLEMKDITAALRDHGPVADGCQEVHPKDNPYISICMHAGAKSRAGQTTGAQISEINTGNSVHWVTGTGATCLSIFKPLFLDTQVPPHGPVPSDRYDPAALWWLHEKFYRTALQGDFPRVVESVSAERDALEATFRRRVSEVSNAGSSADRQEVTNACWKEALLMEWDWAVRVASTGSSDGSDYRAAWNEMSSLAGM